MSVGPRVLHVAQPEEGGVAGYVADLLTDQAAHGLDVALASPRDLVPPAAADAGAAWHRWPAGRLPDHRVVPELARLGRILRRVRPDVLHLHSAKAGLVGRLLVRGRLPTVFQPHSWSFEAASGSLAAAATAWERRATRWTHCTVFVSHAERERGRRSGIRGHGAVVPNGVDVAAFRPRDDDERRRLRAELGLPAGPLAVFVGRLHRQKGLDVLLAAWPRVRRERPGARLAVIGDGPERQTLRHAAGAGVDFHGETRRVADALACADLVVLPSRWEGLSLVLLEAMAAGACVVATQVDGAREALGPHARLVPPDDPDALAAAVVDALADPGARREAGRRARETAVAHYDVRETRRRIRALYGRLAG